LTYCTLSWRPLTAIHAVVVVTVVVVVEYAPEHNKHLVLLKIVVYEYT